MQQGIMCEMCGLKPAIIHFKQTINGITTEKHLCADCGKQMQIVNLEGFMNPAGIIASAMGGLGSVKPKTQRICKCGTSEAEILRDMKFGCKDCYTVFSDLVDRFLGSNARIVHKGKRLGDTPLTREKNEGTAQNDGDSELLELQKKLRDAVEQEDYNLAAILHKKIKNWGKR